MQKTIRKTSVLFSLLTALTAAPVLAVDPWPAESWSAATDLTFLNASGWSSNLSGAYWNPVTRRLWVVNNSGNFSVLSESAGSFVLLNTFSPGGDLEGITQANPTADKVYTIVERTNAIREYTASTGVLSQTWSIGSLIGSLPDGNDGVEGITFIPDAWLAASGFRDGSGNLYPQSVHGANGLGGIMLVAVQDQTRATAGYVYAVDLNVNGTWTTVGSYKTNMTESCEISFDGSTGKLYIMHNLNGNVLEIADLKSTLVGAERKLNTLNEYQLPSTSNVEGMGLVPALKNDSTLGDGWMFLTDDDNADGALRWFKQVSPRIALNAGNAQTAPPSSSVPVKPSVMTQDAFKNPLKGFPVTFQVTGGGGSITGASIKSDSLGIAQVGSWTLGPANGVNTLTATSAGFTMATFTATGSDGVGIFSGYGPRAGSKSMGIRLVNGAPLLNVRVAGMYQVRQWNTSGRILLEKNLKLSVGQHALPMAAAGVSFFEVRSANEKVGVVSSGF
jgi:hypothetical protein